MGGRPRHLAGIPFPAGDLPVAIHDERLSAANVVVAGCFRAGGGAASSLDRPGSWTGITGGRAELEHERSQFFDRHRGGPDAHIWKVTVRSRVKSLRWWPE